MAATKVSRIECSRPGAGDELTVSSRKETQSKRHESINKVFSRIPVVCQLIVADGGDNLRVEDR
jgi:hypothetical protein